MVSQIWNASSQGNVDLLQDLLKDSTLPDIEIKDQNGITPLIEAIKNGHVEVVRILLDKGANPMNASSQALPEQYTSDPAIVKLLNDAKASPNFHDMSDSERPYDALPTPNPYAYYPGMNPAPPPPPMHDGPLYYPQSTLPTGEHQVTGGPPNLPPPEVARLIPCRFYPACRYGSSCLFAHPQGPYFTGPLPPPAQYPAPYDPMLAQNYAHSYYGLPPPSFQQTPNGMHQHMSPTSPSAGIHQTPPPVVHTRSASEVVSPPPHFSPSGPSPYGSMPPVFPHPGQVPVPLPIPAPPVHPQAMPQSPQSLYNNNTSPTPPFVVRPDVAAPYPSQPVNATQPPYVELNGPQKSPPNPQNDNFASGQAPSFRENGTGHRRGNPRRSSFAGRKPPCLFFPSGRCKNGDDCRFPHIMPENGTNPSNYFSNRNGPRPRGNHANGNSYGAIEEKLANMTVKEESRTPNGADSSSRSHSTDPGSRGRFSHGSKGNHSGNATRAEKKAVVKQRVPNAEDFPVLAGSTTPPARSPGNPTLVNGLTHSGPTAAQVLQAPPPARKDTGKETTSPSNGSPDPEPAKVHRSAPQVNGVAKPSAPESLPHKHAPCAPTASGIAPDIATEVSVFA